MATIEECEVALRELTSRLHSVDHDVRRKHAVDRSIACTISDLDVSFYGHLVDGTLVEADGDSPRQAQIRIKVRSDDLIALTEGDLPVATAWATGRLRIDASMLDLLRLRNLL